MTDRTCTLAVRKRGVTLVNNETGVNQQTKMELPRCPHSDRLIVDSKKHWLTVRNIGHDEKQAHGPTVSSTIQPPGRHGMAPTFAYNQPGSLWQALSLVSLVLFRRETDTWKAPMIPMVKYQYRIRMVETKNNQKWLADSDGGENERGLDSLVPEWGGYAVSKGVETAVTGVHWSGPVSNQNTWCFSSFKGQRSLVNLS